MNPNTVLICLALLCVTAACNDDAPTTSSQPSSAASPAESPVAPAGWSERSAQFGGRTFRFSAPPEDAEDGVQFEEINVGNSDIAIGLRSQMSMLVRISPVDTDFSTFDEEAENYRDVTFQTTPTGLRAEFEADDQYELIIGERESLYFCSGAVDADDRQGRDAIRAICESIRVQ